MVEKVQVVAESGEKVLAPGHSPSAVNKLALDLSLILIYTSQLERKEKKLIKSSTIWTLWNNFTLIRCWCGGDWATVLPVLTFPLALPMN